MCFCLELYKNNATTPDGETVPGYYIILCSNRNLPVFGLIYEKLLCISKTSQVNTNILLRSLCQISRKSHIVIFLS